MIDLKLLNRRGSESNVVIASVGVGCERTNEGNLKTVQRFIGRGDFNKLENGTA